MQTIKKLSEISGRGGGSGAYRPLINTVPECIKKTERKPFKNCVDYKLFAASPYDFIKISDILTDIWNIKSWADIETNRYIGRKPYFFNILQILSTRFSQKLSDLKKDKTPMSSISIYADSRHYKLSGQPISTKITRRQHKRKMSNSVVCPI